jgi:hypothetical protein
MSRSWGEHSILLDGAFWLYGGSEKMVRLGGRSSGGRPPFLLILFFRPPIVEYFSCEKARADYFCYGQRKRGHSSKGPSD